MRVMPLPRIVSSIVLAGLLVAASGRASSADREPTAREIVDEILAADPWGLGGAEVKARAIITDAKGKTRTLSFTARSRRHDPPLSKSLVRFLAPADLAGTSFLQIQQPDGDDGRWLFLPELGRSRRVAGDMRRTSFMGTDFSYADVDRRDLRDADVELAGSEKLGSHDCWKVVARPRGDGALYGRIEIWARKDNLVPLKWTMHGRSGVHVKTLTAKEIRRIDGRWFITRSVMESHEESRSTELHLDEVIPREDIPDEEFSVRNLEKI
jgi:outer membrane lipoprotein-sorting protein